MKREAKLLFDKACDSLVLSGEFFNRPDDRGRVSSSLILLDHAFEMLLKSAILHRGGRIREKRAKETIGFDACVRRGLSDGAIKFLTEEQALLLQTINGLRDAAQHHLLDVSEGQLYMHAQAGVTLFRDLLKSVFGTDIHDYLPARVLPISTSPPTDLATLTELQKVEDCRIGSCNQLKSLSPISEFRRISDFLQDHQRCLSLKSTRFAGCYVPENVDVLRPRPDFAPSPYSTKPLPARRGNQAKPISGV